MSAVDDLLNALLESKDANLLGAYIGSVMPDNSEWEKMRQGRKENQRRVIELVTTVFPSSTGNPQRRHIKYASESSF